MQPIVEVESLSKRYRGADRNALDGVSFQVRPGELFTLLGPNGAGKTTTISILTTTLQPTAGHVRIAGHDVVRAAARVRREVGIIFQRPSLDLNLTAEENVRFHAILYGLYPYRPTFRLMPRAYREQVAELAGLLELSSEIFHPIRTFSGGMRRKLEIIRSLIHRPRVLFLDEPTTGLDAASRRSLWQYLAEMRARVGTTLVLTTHYLEEAEGADTVCIVNRGRVVALGSTREVKAQLVEEFLVVAAADPAALRAELDTRGIAHRPLGDGRVRLDVAGPDTHRVLRAITTPLSLVETHRPTLEDAYLEIVGRDQAA